MTTSADVHRVLAAALDFGPSYGANFYALRDRLSDTERPFTVVWHFAPLSRERLGEDFSHFVREFEDVAKQTESLPERKQVRFLVVE